jgi:hypothetical protein
LRWRIQLRSFQEALLGFIKWLRSIGSGACLLGLLGLFQTLFYPSVICFYVGVAILIADFLLLERQPVIVNWIVSSLLVGVAIVFWHYVVAHPNPISFGYIVDGGRLDVKIGNDSSTDDYKDVDLTIFPDDRDKVFVGEVKQINLISGCSLISDIPDQLAPGERTLIWANPNPTLHYSFASNQIRISCPWCN